MIVVLPEPCRVLRDRGGQPPDEEFDAHYATVTDAETARADEQEQANDHFAALQAYVVEHPGTGGRPILRTVTVEVRPGCCAELKCDECGSAYEVDGATVHLPAEDIVEAAVDGEWEASRGRHYCGWRCSPPYPDGDEVDAEPVAVSHG